MIDTTYALGVLTAMALVTFGLRALPFLAARFFAKPSAGATSGQIFTAGHHGAAAGPHVGGQRT